MGTITNYIAHDPVGNCEAYVTEFEPDLLRRAEANGIMFIAVHDDGTREVVKAEDVRKPANDGEGQFVIVQPAYVDERIAKLTDALEDLAALFTPLRAIAAKISNITGITIPAGAEDKFNSAIAEVRELLTDTREVTPSEHTDS